MQRRGIKPEWSFQVDELSYIHKIISKDIDERMEQQTALKNELVDFELERDSILAALAIISSEKERKAAITSPFLRPYNEIMEQFCENLPQSELEGRLHEITGRIERNKERTIKVLAALEISKADLVRVETILKCPWPRRIKDGINSAYMS